MNTRIVKYVDGLRPSSSGFIIAGDFNSLGQCRLAKELGGAKTFFRSLVTGGSGRESNSACQVDGTVREPLQHSPSQWDADAF